MASLRRARRFRYLSVALPRVYEREADAFEIGDVARDQNKSVDHGRCRDQAISIAAWPINRLSAAECGTSR